jgi:hypothetical protein
MIFLRGWKVAQLEAFATKEGEREGERSVRLEEVRGGYGIGRVFARRRV